MCTITNNVGFPIQSIEVKGDDPLNYWLLSTKNGKILVWNRKDFSRENQNKNRLANIHELEYYLVDNYKFSALDKKERSTLHGSNLEESSALAKFSPRESNIYLAYRPQGKIIVFRNYREHLVKNLY